MKEKSVDERKKECWSVCGYVDVGFSGLHMLPDNTQLSCSFPHYNGAKW